MRSLSPLLLVLSVTAFAPVARTQSRALPGSMRALPSDSALATYLRRLMRSDARRACHDSVQMHAPPEENFGGTDQMYVMITGKVLDSRGQGFRGSTVEVEGADLGMWVMDDGQFVFIVPKKALAADGGLTVTASHYAHFALPFRFTPRAGAHVSLTFTLCPKPQEPTETHAVAPSVVSYARTPVQGVQEGDIAQWYGSSLYVLRGRMLYGLRLTRDSLVRTSAMDLASIAGESDRIGFQQLFLVNDRLIAVGTDRPNAAMLLALLRVDGVGHVRVESVYQLRSNDWYLAESGLIRVVGRRLIAYTPVYVPWAIEDPRTMLPSLRRIARSNPLGPFVRVPTAGRVFIPAREWDAGSSVALHTVTVCDLARAELECRATVVAGAAEQGAHISSRAVYAWATGYRRVPLAYPPNTRGFSPRRVLPAEYRTDTTSSMILRIPLDGGAPTALGAVGRPAGETPFLEDAAGFLNVVVGDDSVGDWIWPDTTNRMAAALLRVPLTSFGDGSGFAPPESYRGLMSRDEWSFPNRFVGGLLVYSTHMDPYSFAESNIGVMRLDGGLSERFEVDMLVAAIEVARGKAVLRGTDTTGLRVATVLPSARTHLHANAALPIPLPARNYAYGYYAYAPTGSATGIIALSVADKDHPPLSAGRFTGHAGVFFVSDSDGVLAPLGILNVRDAETTAVRPRATCSPGYPENARPLFFGHRIFVMLDCVLVEARVRDGHIVEIWRRDFESRASSPPNPSSRRP